MGVDQKSYDLIIKFLNEVIKPLLPNANYAGTRFFSAGQNPIGSFEGNLSCSNIFQRSIYEFKGNNTFLHFTNLHALDQILEKGWIRMTRLDELEKNELSFASELFADLSLFPEKIEEQKKQVFALSATKSNEETLTDSFMWQEYGDKGHGIALEFSFTSLPTECYPFGEIQYGESAVKPMIELRKRVIDFKVNHTIQPYPLVGLFTELFSFHKRARFKNEKEVRMLFSLNDFFQNHNLFTLYDEISKGHIQKFVKIFLKGKHPLIGNHELNNSVQEVITAFPQIEVKRIILGYEIPVDNKLQLVNYFVKERKVSEEQIWEIDEDLIIKPLPKLDSFK